MLEDSTWSRGDVMATTHAAVTTMRLAQIARPGGDFQIVEREIPDPGTGHVRIKVQACGVCHSDVFTKEGQWRAFSIRVYPVTK